MGLLRETWLHHLVCSVVYLSVTSALAQSPPRIIKEPSTEELLFYENDNVRPLMIECEADGDPAPEYSWIKNGTNFDWQAYDDRISQQPGQGTLVITSPRDEDVGQYQCLVKNKWGTTTSKPIFVNKSVLNSFNEDVIQPQQITANEGEPFKLTCKPPYGRPKPEVYWLMQNAEGKIRSINNSRLTSDPEGNIWFSFVTKQDASEEYYYTCAAASHFRQEYKLGNRVLLKVISKSIPASQNRYAPVQQYVTRKNEVALKNNEVVLYCIFGGMPLPQTVWSKDGQQLPTTDRITRGNYGKSLIIKDVNLKDEGSYTCEVSNGVGEVQTHTINLKIT